MDPATPALLQNSARRRYFPGWTMVGIAAAAQFLSAPGQSYSVAVFKEPMRFSLGIGETDYSLAYAFATIISGLSLPFVGRMIDRYGARRMLPAIGILLGTACLGMSMVSNLTGLYISFSFVRSLGQGALTLVAAWLVGEWFCVRRGFATALAGFGSSLSVMLIPLLNGALISAYGWPTAWVVLGALVGTVLVLPPILLVRDRPEELGLRPDGLDLPAAKPESPKPETVNRVEQATSAEPPTEPSAEPHWTVGEVLRDLTFWKLLAVPATSGMVGTGLIFHQVSLLGSRGISSEGAIGLISLQAGVATFAALGAGWLTDRWQNRRLLALAMGLMATSVAIVLLMSVPWLAIVYATLAGLHGSILRSTGSVVWLTYYGRNNQGAIRGVAMAVMIFGAAIGPLPLAFAADYYGSYDAVLLAFIAAPLAAGALVWTATPPANTNTEA